MDSIIDHLTTTAAESEKIVSIGEGLMTKMFASILDTCQFPNSHAVVTLMHDICAACPTAKQKMIELANLLSTEVCALMAVNEPPGPKRKKVLRNMTTNFSVETELLRISQVRRQCFPLSHLGDPLSLWPAPIALMLSYTTANFHIIGNLHHLLSYKGFSNLFFEILTDYCCYRLQLRAV